MKAVFLDRDGVINKYPGDKRYVTGVSGFRFLPKAKKAIAKLRRSGFGIFVISNQAGVGKGIFSLKTLDAITKKMLNGVKQSGGKIDAVCYCVHRKEQKCFCRKPKSGMIDVIRKKHEIKMRASFFIGDTIRDVKTAKAAGCKSILVLSGKEKLSGRRRWEAKPDFVFSDLSAAADFILNKKISSAFPNPAGNE